MAYVEVREKGKLTKRISVSTEEARAGCWLKLGKLGKVRMTLGESKTMGDCEVRIVEDVPGNELDAHPAAVTSEESHDNIPSTDAKQPQEPTGNRHNATISKAEPTSEHAGPEDLPQIDGYRVIGKLGEGGMGAVWRAVQLGTRREVALKLLSSRVFGSEKALRRFEREVELAARLEHPGIARVYDSGLHQNVHYYAMELIEGVHLDEYVEANDLSHRQIMELVQTIAEALQHAHKRGIIHRDLKPSNIMVTEDGHPYVLDFGLAKTALDDDDHHYITISMTGDVTGTPAYMSPEQAAGRVGEISTQADVYSLGVILYRLLIRQFPHDLSGTKHGVLRRIAEDEIKRPRQVSKKIDRDIEALLLKALAQAPAKRYRDAGQLAADIGNYLAGDPLEAKTPTALYFLRKRVEKHARGFLIGFLAVMAVAGLALAVWSVGNRIGDFERRRRAETARSEASQKRQKAQAISSEKWLTVLCQEAEKKFSGGETAFKEERYEPAVTLFEASDRYYTTAARFAASRANIETLRKKALDISAHKWLPVLCRKAESEFDKGKMAFKREKYEPAVTLFEASGENYTMAARFATVRANTETLRQQAIRREPDIEKSTESTMGSTAAEALRRGDIAAQRGDHDIAVQEWTSATTKYGKAVLSIAELEYKQVLGTFDKAKIKKYAPSQWRNVESLVEFAGKTEESDPLAAANDYDKAAKVLAPAIRKAKEMAIADDEALLARQGAADMRTEAETAKAPTLAKISWGNVEREFADTQKLYDSGDFVGAKKAWDSLVVSYRSVRDVAKKKILAGTKQMQRAKDARDLADKARKAAETCAVVAMVDQTRAKGNYDAAQKHFAKEDYIESERLWKVADKDYQGVANYATQINDAKVKAEGGKTGYDLERIQKYCADEWSKLPNPLKLSTDKPISNDGELQVVLLAYEQRSKGIATLDAKAARMETEAGIRVSKDQAEEDIGKCTDQAEKDRRLGRLPEAKIRAQEAVQLATKAVEKGLVTKKRLEECKRLARSVDDAIDKKTKAEARKKKIEQLRKEVGEYLVKMQKAEADGDYKRADQFAVKIIELLASVPELQKTTQLVEQFRKRIAEYLLPYKVAKTCKGHESTVTSVAFSPLGTSFASGSIDSTVRLCSVKGKAQTDRSLSPGIFKWIYDLKYSPDGSEIVVAYHKSVATWNIRTGKRVSQIVEHGDLVSAASYSPDGKNILSSSIDGRVTVHTIKGKLVLRLPRKHEGGATWASYCDGGKKIVTGSANGLVHIWDSARGKLLTSLKRPPNDPLVAKLVGVVCVSHDMSTIAVQRWRDNRTGGGEGVGIWRLQGQNPKYVLMRTIGGKSGEKITSSALSPSGNRIVCGEESGQVGIWNTATGKRVAILPGQHSDWVTAVAFSPDGRYIVSGSRDRTLILRSANSGGAK